MGDDVSISRKITSREFKLILSPDKFIKRGAGAAALGDIVVAAAERNGGELIEMRDEEERRRTWYLDSPDWDLRQNQYALRVRHEIDDDRYKTTLKFRSRDRYVAAARDLTEPNEGRYKFEEDILPRFRSQFSCSNSVRSGNAIKLDSLGEASDLFPAVGEIDPGEDVPLARVNDFEAREVFRKLCKLRFGAAPNVKAGISFWYRRGQPDDSAPLIAEFAFDYDIDEDEPMSLSMLERTNAFFGALQGQPGWFDFDATTKTRYVYEGLG